LCFIVKLNLYLPLYYMVEAKYDELGNKLVNEAGDITFKCPNCGKFRFY